MRLSAWIIAPLIALLAVPIEGRFSFPETKFPVSPVERHADLISQSRIFTLDSWADYLTFRFYPQQKIFIDGRSDFFGKDLSEKYLQVLNGKPGWADVLREYQCGPRVRPRAERDGFSASHERRLDARRGGRRRGTLSTNQERSCYE